MATSTKLQATTAVPRRALTMLEVVIATVIFAVISVSVIEAMTQTARFTQLNESRNDLARDANKIMAQIGEDLSRSGWYFPSFVDSSYDVSNFDDDRRLIYYPFVLQQSPNGPTDTGSLAEGFPATTVDYDTDVSATSPNLLHALRTADQVALFDPSETDQSSDAAPILGLPGEPSHFETNFGDVGLSEEDYHESFYARSQELVFLMAANSSWSRTPDEQERDLLFFEGDSALWNTPDPQDVETAVDTRIATLIAGGMAPLDAIDEAHRQIRNEMFDHGDIGVLRMSEFYYRFQTVDPLDPNSDLVLDADGHPIPVPWDIDRNSAVAESEKALATLQSPGAWIDIDPTGQVQIRVRWETNVDEDSVVVESDVDSNQKRIRTTQLREYLYAVVPSPYSGRSGRLVRAFSVNFADFPDRGEGSQPGQWISRTTVVGIDRGFVVDKVLSDDVIRIVFDTWRTDTRTVAQGRLGLNEVRVRLYLATRYAQQQDGLAFHLAEGSFTMRTSNNAQANSDNQNILGIDGVGFDY